MPGTRRPFLEMCVFAGIFLAGAATLVLSAMSMSHALRELTEISLRVRGDREALTALFELRLAVRDAELGVRGYVVTGERAYLRAYEGALKLVPERWSELVREVDTPRERAAIAALAPLLAAKLDALHAFAEQGPRRPDVASATRLIDRNQRTLEAMNAAAGDLEKFELAEEASGLSRRDVLAREALIVGRVETGIGLALVLLVFGVLARQIFNRHRAEASAEDARGLMDTVFDSMAEGVIVAAADGRAVVFNPSAERLLGGKPQAAATGRWAELQGLYKSDCATPLAADEMPLVRALSGRDTDRADVCVRKPSGEHTFLSATGRPLYAADGRVIGGVVVFYDVTARRSADAEIRRLNGHLQKSVHELSAANRELEGFTFSVSHGLRGPLRALDGFARLLDRRLEGGDAESRRMLGVIQTNAKRMGGLMDDLLAYTDLGRRPLRAATVDMAKLVRTVFEEALRALDAGRPELVVGALPPAHVDPDMIREAWLNLLSNAVKFSAHAERPRVEVGTAGSNGKTIYFVRDNGVGFNMRYSHRLFGVFQRLHGTDEFEGSGVGLAIVKRIVDRHGGQIWAQAEEGVGATFYLSLPSAEEEHGGAA